jgi:hypothetical protein
MVREREAPAPQPPRNHAPLPAKPLEEVKNSAPQFGETSPLRNPLKQSRESNEYAHLFNRPKPGQRRPEHFAAAPRVPSQPPPLYTTQQIMADPFSRPFKMPAQQSAGRPDTASSTGSDFMEITASDFQPRQPPSGGPNVPALKPQNAPQKTTYPPPRPIYSSMGAANGFQPVNRGAHNPLQAPRQTVILDDEDDFDPDAAIRAEGDRFGAPDMHAYVDSGAASENIKALLEGAFDDDNEKIPRTLLRKKKKLQEDDTG